VTTVCGCEVTNVLFCYPRLIFGGDAERSNDGFTILSRLVDERTTSWMLLLGLHWVNMCINF